MLLILWMNIDEKEIKMPEFRGSLTDDFTLPIFLPLYHILFHIRHGVL